MFNSCCLLSPAILRARLLHTFPSFRIIKRWLLKLGFILMEHQGTANYFSLKEADFGLKTAGGILSLTQGSAPNTEMASSLHKGFPRVGDPAPCTHYTRAPHSPAPGGLPIVFLTLLTRHYLPLASLRAQLQEGLTFRWKQRK